MTMLMVMMMMVVVMMIAGTIWGRRIYIITWRYEWKLNKRQDCLLSKPRFMTIHVFWDEKLCLCASSFQHCHRSQRLCILELLDSEDEGKIFLRNVGMYCRRNDAVSHRRRPESSVVSPWITQNSRDLTEVYEEETCHHRVSYCEATQEGFHTDISVELRHLRLSQQYCWSCRSSGTAIVRNFGNCSPRDAASPPRTLERSAWTLHKTNDEAPSCAVWVGVMYWIAHIFHRHHHHHHRELRMVRLHCMLVRCKVRGRHNTTCEHCQFRHFHSDQRELNITTFLWPFTSTMAIYRVGLLFISGLLALERTTPLRIASDDAGRTVAVYTVM